MHNVIPSEVEESKTKNMHTREEKLQAFGRILDVLDELREKCPWDRKQTNESLRPQTLEEVYELSDAILKGEEHELSKELGDVLLHVLFYAKIGEEKQHFDIVDVINFLCDKLIYRHPHVYGDIHAETPEAVKQNWEALKLRKKRRKSGTLGGVPVSLPAMVKAYRVGEKAASVGFDWNRREDVWDKVREELMEVDAEIKADDKERLTDEMGDLFFALINACRLYGIDPEGALERTNKKFIRRFGYVEQQAEASGRMLADMTLEEMDRLWEEAKQKEEQA